MRPALRALEKKDLLAFFQDLMEHFDLYAPLRLAEGVSVYGKVTDPTKEIDLASPNSRKPLKEVFFPQSEVMFCYERSRGRTEVFPPEGPRRERVCFGSRPCDIQAMVLFDLVFGAKDPADVYYLEKRAHTTIVGLACDAPLTTCFCNAMGGGPFCRDGSDLFMIDLGETYLVEFLTQKGGPLSKSPFLREAPPTHIPQAREVEARALEKLSPPSLSLEGIDQRLEEMLDSPIWERVQEKCVGCRVCTYLCPTCHCFDIWDEGCESRGRRLRTWDSCLSALYTLETSGHNPRPTNRERTRQRLMHKFHDIPKNFGRLGCVGCGRCIRYCPAQFDIRKVLKEIVQEGLRTV